MSRIEDLLAELAPRGVERSRLGDIGKFIRGNGLQKSDLSSEGFPAIHYGQIHTTYGIWTKSTRSFTDPEKAVRLRRAKPGDLLIATTSEDDAAVAKATAWIGAGEVALSGDAYIFRHTLDPKFVAYFFQSTQFNDQKQRFITGTKVRRISGDSLAKVLIPVPPQEVQREIVRILDQFTELEAELEAALEAELEARRRQYEHYRHELTKSSDMGIETTLGELFDMRSGRFIAASAIAASQSDNQPYPCYGGNDLRGYVSNFNQDGEHVLIGRQGALSGNTKRVSGRFYATEHAVVVTAKGDTDVDWAYHKLTSMGLNQYVSKGAQPGLAVGTLKALSVAVPNIAEQRRIGSALNSFDALVNDLSIGLPAELRARRKQYEHYRGKLLTFKEAN